MIKLKEYLSTILIDIFSELKFISHVDSGTESVNYLVGILEKKYIAKIYITKNENEVKHELFLISNLQNFILIPQPIAIRAKFINFISGYPLVLFKYINDPQPNAQNVSTTFFYKLGYALGLFHSKTLNVPFNCYWCENKIIDYLKYNRKLFPPEIIGCIDKEMDDIQINLNLNNSNYIIHGDISFKNLFYDRDLTFIDFSDTTKGNIGLEIGIIIRNMFLKNSVPHEYFRYFIIGYNKSNHFDFYNLNYWTKLACIRYILLMHSKFLNYSYYPNKLEENYLLLKKADNFIFQLSDS